MTSRVILSVKLAVEGYVKITNNTPLVLVTPYKFKGWFKKILKDTIARRENLPAGMVKGIVRYVDYMPKDPDEHLRIVASPLVQFFGAPAKNCQWFKINNVELCRLLLFIHQPPRIKILIRKPPKIRSIEYIQGTRDDVSGVATENPHTIKLAELLEPIEIFVKYTLTPFDNLQVPEWATPRVVFNKQYYEAYIDMMYDLLKEIKKPDLPSPFGGRAFHTVKVDDVQITEESVTLPALSPDLERIVSKYWSRLPDILR